MNLDGRVHRTIVKSQMHSGIDSNPNARARVPLRLEELIIDAVATEIVLMVPICIASVRKRCGRVAHAPRAKGEQSYREPDTRITHARRTADALMNRTIEYRSEALVRT